MSDDALSFRYELTAEWAKQISSARRSVGFEVWAYFVLGFVMLAVAAMAIGVAIGGALTLPFEMSSSGVATVSAMLGFGGVVAVAWWATRVSRLMGQAPPLPYAIGSEVIYDMDALGIRMQCNGQDWWTSWSHVRRIHHTRDLIALVTPFAVLVMPVEPLPVPEEEAVTRMTAWQAEARR